MHPPSHDDVIKWKHFSRYWPFVLGIHRSPSFDVFFDVRLNKRLSKQSRRRYLRRHRSHYDVTVTWIHITVKSTGNERFRTFTLKKWIKCRMTIITSDNFAFNIRIQIVILPILNYCKLIWYQTTFIKHQIRLSNLNHTLTAVQLKHRGD